MKKKILCFLLICSFMSLLSGCWSYRGLNEMTIVAGIAIDKDESSGNYKLTFETIDLSGSIKTSGPKPQIVESEGKTIFDAIRNAKKRVINKLYFSDTQIVVISSKIAQQEGISHIIDFFIRDGEPRETIDIIISQEDTAKKILTATGINNDIVSFEAHRIVENDQKITAVTKKKELYEIYNCLNTPGASLVLPVFHQVMNDNKPANSVNGIAVFKEDKLIGYLTPEETKSYLYIMDQIKGGLMTFSATGEGTDNAVLEILKSKTKKSFKYIDNKIKVKIEPSPYTSIAELNCFVPSLTDEAVHELADTAGERLAQDITNVIHKAQYDFKTDIFGFGNMIYCKNPNLWIQINGDWDNLFQTMEFEVEPEIRILNSGYTKET